MKIKLLSIFFVNYLLVFVISASANVWEITDEDVNYVISKFRDNPNEVHSVYKEFNESPYFKSIYKRFSDNYEEDSIKIFQGKKFRDLSKEEYSKLVKALKLFDVSDSEDLVEGERQKRRQIFNIMFLARLTGCPLLAVNQDHSFFYNTLHIYAPEYAKEVGMENRQNFECYPYEQNCTVIGVRKGQNNQTYRTKKIGNDLKENAIIYLYLNEQKTKVDKEKYEILSSEHYKQYSSARISYEFLADYIRPSAKVQLAE